MNNMRKLMETVADLEEGSSNDHAALLSLVQDIWANDGGDDMDNLIVDLVGALPKKQAARLLALWGDDAEYNLETDADWDDEEPNDGIPW